MAFFHHQDRLVNLARAVGAIARFDAGQRRALVQDVIDKQHHPAARILMRSRQPLKLTALQLLSVTRGMDVVDLERELEPGQQLAEGNDSAGHDAYEQWIGAGERLADARSHAGERRLHLLRGVQAIRLLQNFPRLLRTDRVQRWIVLFFE